MANLWGAAGGFQAQQQDQMQKQAFGLNMAQGEIKLGLEKIQLQRAQTLQEMMQNFKPGDAKGPGGMLYNSGLMAFASGDYKGAASAFGKAQQIADAQYKLGLDATNTQEKQAQELGKLMENVHDPQSWAAANLAYTTMFGRPSRYAGLPYDPETVGLIRRYAVSAKDDAQTKAALIKQKYGATQNVLGQKRIALVEQETKTEAIRQKALEKVTGKKPVGINGSVLKSVTDLISQDYGSDAPENPSRQSALIRALARPIAERAQELIDSGVKPAEASERAYQQYRVDPSYFAGLPPASKGEPGSSPAAAIPATWTTKYVPGQYYVNGPKVFRYNENGSITVVKGSP